MAEPIPRVPSEDYAPWVALAIHMHTNTPRLKPTIHQTSVPSYCTYKWNRPLNRQSPQVVALALGLLSALSTSHADVGPTSSPPRVVLRSQPGEVCPTPAYGTLPRVKFIPETDPVKERAIRKLFIDATEALERLRSRVEEWGTVTVSEPLIMTELGQFDLGGPGDFYTFKDYFGLALKNVQGAAAQLNERGFGNSFGLNIAPTFSVDPITGARIARPADAAPLDGTSVELGEVSITNHFSESNVAGPGGLLPDGLNYALSPQTLTVLAGNAKLTELLMRNMANPKKRHFTNPDQTLHFAIVEISCNPGWRTRENYIADVTATAEYYCSSTGKTSLADAGNMTGLMRAPYVFSVLPLMDAQTLDLQNSERSVTQLVAQIAAAYPTAAANLSAKNLMEFVRRYSSDVRTRTPKTVVNSYTSGSSFGFRLMPSLVALRNPADRRSGSANILPDTSFPALVTIVLNRDVMKHYDSVLVQISHRWLLNERPPAYKFWKRFTTPMQREETSDRLSYAYEMTRLKDTYAKLEEYHMGSSKRSNDPVLLPPALQLLRRELFELGAKNFGTTHVVWPFPRKQEDRQTDNSAPIISNVSPTKVIGDQPVLLTIWGHNFLTTDNSVPGKEKKNSAEGLQVWLGNKKGSVLVSSDEQLVVSFDDAPKQFKNAPVVVKTNNGGDALDDAVEIVSATGGGGGASVDKKIKEIQAVLGPGIKLEVTGGVGTPTPTPTPTTPTTPTNGGSTGSANGASPNTQIQQGKSDPTPLSIPGLPGDS